MRLLFFTVAFAVLCSHTSLAAYGEETNCTAGEGFDKSATLSCHTCLGRDSENCELGTTCCKGACFKLIDEKHDIIAKGCTNVLEEDGSMRRKDTTVMLSWANNELLSGEMYFCNSEDYCNEGSSLISSVVVLFVAVGALKAAV